MGNSQYSTFVLIALMVVAFYFLIIRPNKKRQQAQQQTMNSLQPGTRVLMTSGVFGTIVEIGEKQAVLELSPGVHLTVLKQAIARAVKPGDEDEAYEDNDDEFDEAFERDADPALGGASATPTDHDVAQTYGAKTLGTNDAAVNGGGTSPSTTGPNSTGPNSTGPGSTDPNSTAAASPWSAEAPSYPSSSTSPSSTSGTDQDPRSGTNTTPIKD